MTTSKEMAAWLSAQCSDEGEALDALLMVGEHYGWDTRLNEVGLRLLKPDVSDAEDLVSA